MHKACTLLETLPIKFGESPNIGDEEYNERLDAFLGKPNSPEIVQRLGHEKVKKISDQIHRADGEYGSWRYLYVVDGEYVGVLQGVKHKDVNVLSTAFVKPEYRNKKIGSQLLAVVKKQQKNLHMDSNLSKSGARFMGIKENIMSKAGTVISLIEGEEPTDLPFNKKNFLLLLRQGKGVVVYGTGGGYSPTSEWDTDKKVPVDKEEIMYKNAEISVKSAKTDKKMNRGRSYRVRVK